MTITSSGAKCDICGDFILPGMSKSTNPFECKGIKGPLHCHDNCKETVRKAMGNRDWKLLPDGPLRKLFETKEAV
jgi:hypothetical protein